MGGCLLGDLEGMVREYHKNSHDKAEEAQLCITNTFIVPGR